MSDAAEKKANSEADDIEIEEIEDDEDRGVEPEAQNDLEIEVVDDTPEADRGRKRRDPNAKPDIPEDDELEGYSEAVQKRIKALKYEYHEERRAKEEAARIRDEALKFAQQQHQKALQLQRVLSQGENQLATTSKESAEAKLNSAKERYKKAYEEGDADAIAEAQLQMTNASYELSRWSNYQPQYTDDQIEHQRQQGEQWFRQQTQQRPQADPKAQAWAEKNPWFMKDRRMTSFAMGVHEELVRDRGISPQSDQYYEILDQEIRKTFPDRFNDGGRVARQQNRPSPGNVVAAPPVSTGKPRKVKLTQSQLQMCKRLGISPESYARELMEGQSNG